jgi:hypothetical protein
MSLKNEFSKMFSTESTTQFLNVEKNTNKIVRTSSGPSLHSVSSDAIYGNSDIVLNF